MLTDWLTPTYDLLVLRGVQQAAREHGISIVVFTSGLAGVSPDAYWQVGQVIGRASIDGVIVLASGLAHQSESERQALLSAVCHLPLCCVGGDLPEASSVCVDNGSGMTEIVDHLIQAHGCRKLGFVSGAAGVADAEQRLAAFRGAMATHGLAVDERLILPGDFRAWSAEPAVRTLLDDRQVSLRDMDALVAANDTMAWACVEALLARGIRVPWQLPVVGFDDIAGALQSRIPLTTVRQPIQELGEKAVELLLAQIDGASAEHATLPTELVIRRSCGCLEGIGRLPLTDADLQRRGRRGLEVELLERRGAILADMQRASQGQFDAGNADWAPRLVSALVDELKGRSPNAFRLALQDTLDRVGAAGQNPSVFQNVVSVLWCHLIPCVLSDPALRTTVEGLLDGARLAIGAATQRWHTLQHQAGESLAASMIEACTALSGSSTLEDVAAVLEARLHSLGISRLSVALHAGGQTGNTVRRVLSFQEGHACVEDTELGASNLPLAALPNAGRSDLVVSPLHAGADVFGIVCMELDPITELVHFAIQRALSSVLHRLRC